MNVRRPGSGPSHPLPRSPSTPSRQNSVATPKPTNTATASSQGQAQGANKPLPPTPQQTQGANKPLPPTPQQTQGANKPLPPTPSKVQDNSKRPVDERLTSAALDSQGHPNTATLDTAHHGSTEGKAPNQQSIHGHEVTPAAVGEYKMASKQEGTQKTEHKVGTPEHALKGDMKYQNASAGVKHTRGDGTAGIHHQQVNAHASLGRLSQEGEYKKGRFSAKTEGNAAVFHAEGEAALRFNKNPGQRQAIAYANGKALSGVHGIVTGHVGGKHLSAAGRLEGRAGAFAEGQGGFVADQKQGHLFAQGRGNVLAGAEGKAQGQLQVGPFIGYAGIGAKAGVGAEFNAGAGVHNGVAKAQVNMGAALGLGASGSVGAGFDTNWARQHAHRPQWAHFRSAHRHPQAQPQATA